MIESVVIIHLLLQLIDKDVVPTVLISMKQSGSVRTTKKLMVVHASPHTLARSAIYSDNYTTYVRLVAEGQGQKVASRMYSRMSA